MILVSNLTEYVLFLFFVFLARLIGFKRSGIAGNILGRLFFYFLPVRKKIVLQNLKKAFPSMEEDAIYDLAKKNYIHFVTLLFEILAISSSRREFIAEQIKFSDTKKFQSLINDGKAFFLLTAHFGNWELGAISFGIQFSKTLHVLAKQQRNKYVSDWLNKNREKFGNKVILLGASVREIYKAVRSNYSVGIVGDQRGSKDGPRIDFFNQQTSVYTGTAAIAAKTNIPIIIVLCAKQKKSGYIGHVEELKYDDLTCSDAEKEIIITQRYMNILEKYVRLYPEQWFWMHNIWKY